MINRDILVTPDEEIVSFFKKAYTQFYRLSSEVEPSKVELATKAQEAIRKRKIYFFENCLWIRTKEGGSQQLLILKSSQIKFHEELKKQKKADEPLLIICLKARQMGISTYIAADFFTDVITERNVRACIMAHDKATGSLLYNIYRFFYDSLEEELKPVMGTGRREGTRLVFREGSDRRKGLNSEIEVLVPQEASNDATGSLGRGMTSHYLHISELAFWSNPSASLTSLLQSFADKPNSKCIIESTARQAGDYFHVEWERACEGKSDYHPIFLPWFTDDTYTRPFRTPEERDKFEKDLRQEYDSEYGNECAIMEQYGLTLEQMNWRRRVIRNKCNGDKNIFFTEYPSNPEEAFQHAKGNYLSGSRMSIFIKKAFPPTATGDFVVGGMVSKPYLKPVRHPLVAIWSRKGEEEPFQYAEYIIGVDVSENLPSGDYSAAVVLRRMPLRVVARLRGNDHRKPLTEEFCEQLALMGKYFNNAKILIECNSIGQEVIRRVRDIEGYTRLITLQELHPELNRPVIQYGLRTSTTTRRQLVDSFKEIFEGKEDFECPDEILLKECMALAPNEHGKVEAPKKGRPRAKTEPEVGYYDDLAFALAIAYYAHLRLPAPRTQEQLRFDMEKRESILYERTHEELRHPDYAYLDYV